MKYQQTTYSLKQGGVRCKQYTSFQTYLQLPESIKSRIIFIRCVSEPLIDHHPVCFSPGIPGKTVDFQEVSHCHRTTTAYFLNHGKWKDDALQDVLKSSILQAIYREAQRSGQPIYCIVDDTIASHTRPSSQAVHPIEAAYFHQSHLKGCQDYGHQVVSVMLSCNGITLNYAVILYDKSRSKIQIVQEIAEELPAAPVISYFLCDSWILLQSDGPFYSERILYGWGIKDQPNPLSMRDPSKSQCICPSFAENRPGCQPRDRWQP